MLEGSAMLGLFAELHDEAEHTPHMREDPIQARLTSLQWAYGQTHEKPVESAQQPEP